MYTVKCDHIDNMPTGFYAKWMREFYGENKAIVSAVEHGQNNNPHVHFIGYSNMNEDDFVATKDELAEKHPKKTVLMDDGKTLRFPGCRPVRMGKKKVTELGFQYVMKTSAKPEASQGFTEAELEELKQKSDDHVEKLKSGAKDHCHARSYTGTPDEVHVKIHSDTIDFNKANGTALRPQIAMDTINTMLSHPQARDEWVRYVKRKTMLK